jgi:putative hydrolase of the HAD superfamily
MIRAVTFDVTQTLIHAPRLGEIYSEVLGRHGIAVAPGEAAELVRRVWRELSCLADPGSDRFRSHPEGARGWWQRFLERICEYLEVPLQKAPSRFAGAELFHRFGTAEAWEVFPDVFPVLTELRSRGIELGIVSNWDERLPVLLERLRLSPYFTTLVYSSAAGMEKPNPLLFRQALLRLRVKAEEALHVGDASLEDVEGAMAAGMHAVRLSRNGGVGLRDLRGIAALVASL